MSRALVTLAIGPHAELLDIARPSFEAFADTHGYDLIQPDLFSERPISWWKVPALKAALAEYDEALWLDADTVIVDGSEDLDAPEDAWQALVRHRTGDGDVPNCGVWFMRKPMLPVLDQVWAQTQWLDDGFWEQAALHSLMGFSRHPVKLVQPSGLYEQTHWLDNGWNHHMWDTPGPEHVRIAHATMHKDRASVMREWAAGNVPKQIAECGHRYLIRGCICDPALVTA